jgi:heavy metal sensor kinase
MVTRSIGFRLTAWYAVILTAGFVLFGASIWFSLRHRLIGEFDQDLRAGAARFEQFFRHESHWESPEHLPWELNEFCQGLPAGSSIQLRGPNGYSYHFAAQGPHARTLHQRFELDGRPYDIEIRGSLASVEHTLDLLRLLLLCVSPLVILVACLGGAWLSRRALRPVTDLTAAALNISIENLSQRLPVPPTGDELARLTEVLNTMLARLENAVKTLSQFVADASHEFRTPLAVIRTSAELALRRARSPEAYRESLNEISAEAERMTTLVEDLLTLARADAGAVEMPLVPLDLNDVLRGVLAEMRPLAEHRKIEIRPQFSGHPAMVSGNHAALHRLFLVLLDNATQYSQGGAHVYVMVSGSSVEIRDEGSGIAPADLPHIFKRFYQADPARGQGFGLGLSLAETIVKAHNGKIRVQSEPGQGSTFTVVLAPSRAIRETQLTAN